MSLKSSSAFVEVWLASWVRSVFQFLFVAWNRQFSWEHKSTPDECVSTATCMWTLTSTPAWASFLYYLDSHFYKPFNYLIIQVSSKTKNEICEYCWNKAVSQTQRYPTFALYYPHCPHIFLFTSPILAALTSWNLFSATSVSDQLLVCLKKSCTM